ncbi:hypothetical protein ABZT06_13385 [Streptomyces sp. NPDC005483]|uniref:hypothetical protein n=1 Tax=Streptomyces sp. NPDC005483 TaxID=3154882 RepID=UPI0033A37400
MEQPHTAGALIAGAEPSPALFVDAATFAVPAPLLAFGVRGLREVWNRRWTEPASLRVYRGELAQAFTP